MIFEIFLVACGAVYKMPKRAKKPALGRPYSSIPLDDRPYWSTHPTRSAVLNRGLHSYIKWKSMFEVKKNFFLRKSPQKIFFFLKKKIFLRNIFPKTENFFLRKFLKKIFFWGNASKKFFSSSKNNFLYEYFSNDEIMSRRIRYISWAIGST